MKLRPDGLTEEVPASFASPSREPEEPVGGAGVAPQLLTLINSAIVCSFAGGRGATLQLSDVVFLERRDSTLPKLRAPWQRVGWLCCIRLYLQHGLSSSGASQPPPICRLLCQECKSKLANVSGESRQLAKRIPDVPQIELSFY